MEEVVRHLVDHYPDASVVEDETEIGQVGGRWLVESSDRGPEALRRMTHRHDDSVPDRAARAYWADSATTTPDVVVDGSRTTSSTPWPSRSPARAPRRPQCRPDALTDVQPSSAGSLVWGTVPTPDARTRGTGQRHVRARPGFRRRWRTRPCRVDGPARGDRRGGSGGSRRKGADLRHRRRLRHRLPDSLQALGGFAAHTDRGWHSSGTMGSFAAPRQRREDASAWMPSQFADALGIAGSFTGGVWAFIDDGAWTKRIHPGKAGETGVDAALLARGGSPGRGGSSRRHGADSSLTYTGGNGSARAGARRTGRRLQRGHVLPQAVRMLPRMPFGHRRRAGLRPRSRPPAGGRSTHRHHRRRDRGQHAVGVPDRHGVRRPVQPSLRGQLALALSAGVGLDQFDPPRIDEPRIRRDLRTRSPCARLQHRIRGRTAVRRSSSPTARRLALQPGTRPPRRVGAESAEHDEVVGEGAVRCWTRRRRAVATDLIARRRGPGRRARPGRAAARSRAPRTDGEP